MRVALSDPETLRGIFAQSAYAYTGQKADAGFIDRMVQQWQAEERGLAERQHSADTTGSWQRDSEGNDVFVPGDSTVTGAPDQTEWFRQSMWENQPDEMRVRSGLERSFAFFGMLGEGGGKIAGY
jgi:hypothetical protein